MLDILNEQLIAKGEEPIAFDHDCREGICGMCSLMINGVPHGPARDHDLPAPHAQFKDGDEICDRAVARQARSRSSATWCVDRSAFDRIIAAGGFITVNTGSAPRRQRDPDPEGGRRPGDGRRGVHRLRRMRRRLPERLGDAVRRRQDRAPAQPAAGPARALHRAPAMVARWTRGFGNCTNHYECEAACPKEIPRDVMAELNREYGKAAFIHRDRDEKSDGGA